MGKTEDKGNKSNDSNRKTETETRKRDWFKNLRKCLIENDRVRFVPCSSD